jgi:hypothetical protein
MKLMVWSRPMSSSGSGTPPASIRVATCYLLITKGLSCSFFDSDKLVASLNRVATRLLLVKPNSTWNNLALYPIVAPDEAIELPAVSRDAEHNSSPPAKNPRQPSDK